MLLNIPWTIVALIAYNIVAFIMGGDGADYSTGFESELFSIGLLSGGRWVFTIGDLILFSAFIALFVELMKSARTTDIALVDHGLSIIIFIVCLIEFILIPQAATSLFFFIMLTALIDVVAGFSIGLVAARRDMGIG